MWNSQILAIWSPTYWILIKIESLATFVAVTLLAGPLSAQQLRMRTLSMESAAACLLPSFCASFTPQHHLTVILVYLVSWSKPGNHFFVFLQSFGFNQWKIQHGVISAYQSWWSWWNFGWPVFGCRRCPKKENNIVKQLPLQLDSQSLGWV